MPDIIPPSNPIRNLEQEIGSYREEGAEISEYSLAQTGLVNPNNFSAAELGQMQQDLKRTYQKLYFNGVSLTDIIAQEKMAYAVELLKQFIAEPEDNAERNAAINSIYTLYLQISNKDSAKTFKDLSDSEIVEFIKFYQDNEDFFNKIIINSHANKWLLKFKKELENAFENFFTRLDVNEFWHKVIYKHLITSSEEAEKQALLNYMIKYVHQGGVLFAPYTAILKQFSKTGALHALTMSVFNNEKKTTIEFNFNNHELVIREIGQIVKMGYGFDEEEMPKFDYQSSVPGRSILDYKMVHTVIHDADVDDQFTAVLNEVESKVYVHNESFWKAVIDKKAEFERILLMEPLLKAYADNYLKEGHNEEMAKSIFQQFPEIDQYKSAISEPSSYFSSFFSQAATENNRYNKIFTVLGRITTSANEIANTFDDYVEANKDRTLNALKLLIRFDHRDEVERLLAPYNSNRLTADQLVEDKIFADLYPNVVQGLIVKKANEDIQKIEKKTTVEDKPEVKIEVIEEKEQVFPTISLPPITPVRDLQAVASQLASQGIQELIVTEGVAQHFTNPDKYTASNIAQVARDMIANQGRTYFNGRPLKDIIDEIRMMSFENILNTYKDQKDLNAALQSLYDFYSILRGMRPIPVAKLSTNNLKDLAKYYRNNSSIFRELLSKTKNEELKALLKKMKATEYDPNYASYKEPESQRMAQVVINDYLLKHINSPAKKQAVFNALAKYNHQGGFNFSASSAITTLFATVNSILDTTYKASNKYSEVATFQLFPIEDGLQVREITPVVALGHVDENADFIQDMEIPNGNLVEFEIIHDITPNTAALGSGYNFTYMPSGEFTPEKGRLYLQVKDDELNYTVVNPNGMVVKDKLNKEEWEAISSFRTLQLAQPFFRTKTLPMLLNVTSERGHTERTFNISVKPIAHVFDIKSWNFLLQQFNQFTRLNDVYPFLIQYAKNYLEHGHNLAMSNAIFDNFPELRTYKPVKQLGMFSVINLKEQEHHKQDSLLTVLGKMDRELKRTGAIEKTIGEDIMENLIGYLNTEKDFVNAMKLLVRIGEEERVIEKLKPYNNQRFTEGDLITSRAFKALYPGIKTQELELPSSPGLSAS